MRWYPRWPHMGYDNKSLEEVMRHTARVHAYSLWITCQMFRFFKFSMWFSVLLALCGGLLAHKSPYLRRFVDDAGLPLFCTQILAGLIMIEADRRSKVWLTYAKLRTQGARVDGSAG